MILRRSAFKLSILLCLLPITGLWAQDLPNFNQFFFNPSLINPSLIGLDGRTSAYIAYRKQWVGIPGSPVSSNFSIQTPTGTGLSMGLTVQNDSRGVMNTTSALVGGSYHVPLKQGTFLRYGLSIGAGSNRTDIDKLQFSTNPSDQVLSSLLQQDIQLLGNAGVSFHSPTFHIGLALPNLFQPTYLNKTPFSVAPLKPLQQVVLHGSYRYYFSGDRHMVEPYLNYRLHQGMPGQVEAAAVVHLSGLFWLGGSFRQGYGASGMAGFKLGPAMAIGYSYSLGSSTAVNMTSHEIQAGYLFGSPQKKAPVYSFVQSEKPKKKFQSAVASRKKKPAARKTVVARSGKGSAAKPNPAKSKKATPAKASGSTSTITKPQTQNTAAAQPQTQTPARTSNPANPAATTPQTAPQTAQNTPAQPAKKDETLLSAGNDVAINAGEQEEGEDAESRHGISHMEDLQEESERLSRLEAHKENPREVHTGDARHADRHEFVKRGNHPQELAAGTYVIAGVFKGQANAQKYLDGLKTMGFKDIDLGFQSERDVWYVHFNETPTVDQAKVIRDRERKIKMFRDAWLLTVQ